MFFSRRKTRVGGRWDRVIAARRKVCSAREIELKPDRGDPESNGLDLITEDMRVEGGGEEHRHFTMK